MLHFVGFRGDEFCRAQKVFGKPDFIHVAWDKRAVAEVFTGDVVLFANAAKPEEVKEFTFDDSAKF